MSKIAWLVAVCCAVLPLAAIAADSVEGPFKSDALVRPEKDGICLSYNASKRSRGKPLDVSMRLSGYDSKIKKRRCVRITSRDEWKKLWKSHAGEKDKLPEIDFSKYMAVAVFHGHGTQQKRLTNNIAEDMAPSWSPFLPAEEEKE
jgi:hypothetical protein